MDNQRGKDEYPHAESSGDTPYTPMTKCTVRVRQLTLCVGNKAGSYLLSTHMNLLPPKQQETQPCKYPGPHGQTVVGLSLEGEVFTSPMTRVRAESQGERAIPS